MRAKRIIFCGSIVNSLFPFEQISDRFCSPVLNEIGTKDVWPALAESVTWGYRASGTNGFNRPDVRDRHHADSDHSDFLKPCFCREYWVPFLRHGRVVSTSATGSRSPWWIRLVSALRLKYAPLIVCAFTLVFSQLVRSPVEVAHNPEKVDLRTSVEETIDAPAAVTVSLEYRDRWIVLGKANVENVVGRIDIGMTSLDFGWRWFVDQNPESNRGWLGIVNDEEDGQARSFSLNRSIETREIMFYFDSDEVRWSTLLDQIRSGDDRYALFTFESVISHPVLRLRRILITQCVMELASVRDSLREDPAPFRLTHWANCEG